MLVVHHRHGTRAQNRISLRATARLHTVARAHVDTASSRMTRGAAGSDHARAATLWRDSSPRGDCHEQCHLPSARRRRADQQPRRAYTPVATPEYDGCAAGSSCICPGAAVVDATACCRSRVLPSRPRARYHRRAPHRRDYGTTHMTIACPPACHRRALARIYIDAALRTDERWSRRESNPHRTHCKCGIFPLEHGPISVAATTRIELACSRWTVDQRHQALPWPEQETTTMVGVAGFALVLGHRANSLRLLGIHL